MLENKSTADIVKETIENDLYLLELLKEDIINHMALARKLLPSIRERNPKATIESVAISLKRFIIQEKRFSISEETKKIISDSQLSTRNDVIHFTLHRNNQVIRQLSQIAQKIKWEYEEVFLLNQGPGEVTVIIDQKNKHLLDVCKNDVIETTAKLSLLSIKESQKNTKKSIEVPGVYHHFISILSRRGINIVELISSLSQLSFVLHSKDLLKAYELLDKNIQYFRKD